MRVRERSTAELGFAAANTTAALLASVAVFWGLPLRSLWLDVPAALIAALLVLSSVALVTGNGRALLVVRVAGYGLLALGLVLTAGLVLGSVFLRATAGIGGGDAVRIVALSVAFAAAYFVLYPLVLLGWVRTRSSARAAP